MRYNNSNKKIFRASGKAISLSMIAALSITPVATIYGTAYSPISTTILKTTTSNVSIIESLGDFESAAVKWYPVKEATGYNVYYRSATIANDSYKPLDTNLIRTYDNHVRADLIGLKEDNYIVKVVPIINGKEDVSKAANSNVISVVKHVREGFAFSKNSPMGTGSGGYNDDGTLAENAQVLYVNSSNVNTVTLDVITNSKGQTTKSVGLANILASRQKGYDKRPLVIRVVGTLKASDIVGLNSTGYLQLKGIYNTTLEGVGDDATLYGFGLLIRNSHNVEIRNLGFMLFPDDAISLDTGNENIWVHNNDIFYGKAGSDADQAKGDGSADVKGKSTYVTISYNHFFDSGKSSLCGMSDTEEFFVTYHHNWFDHSDSRHPRIRVGTVHIYNNYFDGNSKYGVGVTKGGSAFVEANYFRNCKYPMLISLQGTDIYGGSKGTFSGEPGGMIKAYNNHVQGASRLVYHSNDSKQFDAYLATSRNEKVPSTYKSVSGGNTYNNFDTADTMYKYTPHSPEEVPSNVKAFAGRAYGGDFKWTFTSADDKDYGVNKELMNAIINYKSKLVSIGGNSIVTNPPSSDNEIIPELPSIPEEPSTPIPTPPSNEDSNSGTTNEKSNYIHNFTESGVKSDYFSITGNLSSSKGTVKYEGLTLTQCLKLESSTNVTFKTSDKATLTLVFNSTFNGKVLIDGKSYTSKSGIVTVELGEGSHTIKKGDSANLYYIGVNINAEDKNEDIIIPESPVTPETPNVPEVPTVPEMPAEKVLEHNFTTSGKTSKDFSITGNLSSSKGTVKYEGLTLTQCLKLESSTKVSFKSTGESQLVLVFNPTFTGKVLVDGKEYTAKSGIVNVTLKEGSHTIQKADTANLYYISVK